MYAEFLIRHKPLEPDELRCWLEHKFHGENRTALKESPLFSAGEWDEEILFATKTPAYRLLCLSTQDEELQIYVEPVGGNVVTICESVWAGTKNAMSKAAPSLDSVKLVDTESKKDFMTATATTLGNEFKRKETMSPIIVAVAVLVYAMVGVLTFASTDGFKFLAGAVSGVIAALVAMFFAVATVRRGRLNWRQ